MKKFIRTLLRSGKLAFAAIILGAVCLCQAPASAQTGTYIAPRPTTVFNQWVTNGTYSFYWTNWLNPSGWHNPLLFISQYGATNNVGTNQLNLTMYGSPGTGNSYTNPAAGSNWVWTAQPLLTWNQNLTTATNLAGNWTNLNQSLADGMLVFKCNLTIVVTNTGSPLGGYFLQIDSVVTP